MTWHTLGTVSVTKASNTVLGSGTNWVENIRVGDGFNGPDGRMYQITNVASNTSLAIAPAYAGNSASGQSYAIVPVQGYVKKSADRLAAVVNVIEDGAVESLDAADRAKHSATEAKASENKSIEEANRAEADADRAQQASNSAVAVVTGGTASINPEAGKIPIAGPDATIQSAWVHGLDYSLDKLSVASTKALYGDGPYPVLDLQFASATRL